VSAFEVKIVRTDGTARVPALVTHRACRTIEEAEYYIENVVKVLDPDGVERGDYSIDAPERMLRARSIAKQPPSEILEAMERIVDYNWADEEHDFYSGEWDGTHIFEDLREVKGWIEGQRGTTEGE
jgi:hypothetical protein